jgi:hypothetical protein
MTDSIRLDFLRTPSALRDMAGPLWPKPVTRGGVSVPAITADRTAHSVT